MIAAQIDGVVLGLDAATGEVRWRHEMSTNVAPEAGVIFASVATDNGDALIGHQRAVAALAGSTGTPMWQHDPVPEGENSQSLAAIAVGGGIALGPFANRCCSAVCSRGISATGAPLWHFDGDETVGINATPVIAGDSVFVVNAADQVTSIELGTGIPRWTTQLDPVGFEWGNATIGTPAYAHGILVNVPTLYRDLIALDAESGTELWRHAGLPSPLRATHYRGAGEAGYESSPAITGVDVVWAADIASGELAALDLRTGDPLWRTAIRRARAVRTRRERRLARGRVVRRHGARTHADRARSCDDLAGNVQRATGTGGLLRDRSNARRCARHAAGRRRAPLFFRNRSHEGCGRIKRAPAQSRHVPAPSDGAPFILPQPFA